MQVVKGDENGGVVLGDLEYDGRVILYIIKGSFTLYLHNYLTVVHLLKLMPS